MSGKRVALTLAVIVLGAIGSAKLWWPDDPALVDENSTPVVAIKDSVLAPPETHSTSGLTIFPGRVLRGDSLRFIADGRFFSTPDTSLPIDRRFVTGEIGVALAESTLAELRWIEMPLGWVPSAVVDRQPRMISGDLIVGAEGLVAGRVLPWDYAPGDMIQIPRELLGAGVEENVILLRRGALAALQRFTGAGRAAGFDIRVLSGFRSASHQAVLYGRQLSEKGFDQNVSAPPGRSEHQLGTTVDVMTEPATALRLTFGETPQGQWIAQNAADFGFVLSFSLERHVRRRVSYEPWHLRWVDRQIDDPTNW